MEQKIDLLVLVATMTSLVGAVNKLVGAVDVKEEKSAEKFPETSRYNYSGTTELTINNSLAVGNQRKIYLSEV